MTQSRSEPRHAWYVVEAREGKAQDARLRLAAAGMHVWMPMLLKRRADRRSGKKLATPLRRLDTYTPRFGRYFFVRCLLTDSLRHAINDTPSVSGLLCAPGQEAPVALPEAYMAWLSRPEQMIARPAVQAFERGDTVRVTDGPFSGLTSRIEAVDRATALHLLFDLFGRLTPVILDASQVELVLLAKSRAFLPNSPQNGKVRSVA